MLAAAILIAGTDAASLAPAALRPALSGASGPRAYGTGHLMAADPDGGYWVSTTSGDVEPHGGAPQLGSPSSSGTRLSEPIVGMAPTPDGGGYWLVASDGGIFSYGDAGFYGSTGPSTSTNRSWAWRPRLTAAGTGWSPPTAASSPMAMPNSTGRPGHATSTNRSWAWRPRLTAAGTGSSPPTAASSPMAMRGFFGSTGSSTYRADRGHGAHA